ncbi:DUF1289 domain-containing protein [Lichenihabitans sp. PAMC28606]|uniref:DUF1289 domain-containing protein n=1 Tax=Lichenihabitans sp. PAMC28606 TaxID=2880932 RepID=UPI001D0A4827|nr:DUF1289 domain-containing protein [Lichenihabitans sp. PAMC28606]UDL95568.1 DUF1289 domain-containing protein [Lichenihabitans sp. PAMC28606]
MPDLAAATSSPCIKLCRLDEAATMCLGCGRTLEEIGLWGGMSEPTRLAIMAKLPERLVAADRDAAIAET